MKYGLLIISALLVFAACQKEAQGTQVESDEGTSITYYGEQFELRDDAMSTAALVEFMEGKEEQEVTVEGEIVTTCAKKGCWMDVVMPGDKDLKVTFKDYGFFVPTEGMEGKTAIMQGRAYLDTLDVEILRHYAEDAGKSKEEIEKITEPEAVVAFEATGVAIK